MSRNCKAQRFRADIDNLRHLKIADHVMHNFKYGPKTTQQQNLWSKKMKRLSHWRKNDLLCDFNLKCADGKTVSCHKIILALHSDFFKLMFTSQMKDQDAKEIDVFYPSDIVEELVDSLYTGTLSGSEWVQDILVLADMWQIVDVREACAYFMENRIDEQNCFGMYQLASQLNLENIKTKSFNVIKRLFPLLIKTKDFLHISHDTLITILQAVDLDVGRNGEDVVIDAIMKWLEHDIEDRKMHTKELLKNVRFKHVSTSKLAEMCSQPYMSNDIKAEVIDNSVHLPQSQMERRVKRCIYVLGGYIQSRTGPTSPRTDNIERYIPEEDIWTSDSVMGDTIASLRIVPETGYVLQLQNKLYMLSSTTLERSDNQIYCKLIREFDPINHKWNQMTDLSSEHEVLLDMIESCGKEQGNAVLCPDKDIFYVCINCELSAFDIALCDGLLNVKRRVYRQVSSLIRHDTEMDSRRDFSLLAHNGILYFIGGCSRISERETLVHDSMYAYESDVSDVGSWRKLANMRTARAKFAVVCLNECIYVLGGYTSTLRTSLAEKYDPMTDQWTDISPMNSPRCHVSAVSLNGNIYVMGGKSYGGQDRGVRKCVRTCEVYDPAKNCWNFIRNLNQARCMFPAVVL